MFRNKKNMNWIVLTILFTVSVAGSRPNETFVEQDEGLESNYICTECVHLCTNIGGIFDVMDETVFTLDEPNKSSQITRLTSLMNTINIDLYADGFNIGQGTDDGSYLTNNRPAFDNNEHDTNRDKILIYLSTVNIIFCISNFLICLLFYCGSPSRKTFTPMKRNNRADQCQTFIHPTSSTNC